MADDDFIKEEYFDYSNTPTHYSRLNDEDRILFNAFNKIRYRFDMGYISEDMFYSEIDNNDFYGYLNNDELKELERRRNKQKMQDEENIRIKQAKYRQKEENKKTLRLIVLILFILYILFILIKES
jgi:hypothetical protein